MIRLIASDLDGTVLGPDFRFRPRTLEAISAAREAGLQVVFVTGRPHRWLGPLQDQLEDESVAICSNGAVVYDLEKDEILASETVPGSTVLELHRRLAEQLPRATFSAETLRDVLLEPDWADTNILETGEHVRGLLEETLAPEDEVIKFLVRQDGADPRELLAAVKRAADEEVSVTHSVATLPLAEIGQKGLTKGRTLSRWCEAQGISSDQVAAFGDMPNDTEMLRWAGEGYAMASGWPEVIDAVGRTCPAFEEDGVAQVIEDILSREQA